MLTIDSNVRSELESILLEPDFVFTPKKDFENRIKERLHEISKVKGSELAVICLEALAPENPGIRHIAGHHGGAILPFYEFFTKSPLHGPQDSGIGSTRGDGIASPLTRLVPLLFPYTSFDGEYVHVPHEQIAGHIAQGIANTGVVGVAVVTSGPGSTNLITPYYDAYMDSKPVVFISGNAATTAAGSMAFQEAPITKMVKPVSKKTYYVDDAAKIPGVVYKAFYTAQLGRPGPVWIDLPKDMQMGYIDVAHIKYNFRLPQWNYDKPEDVIDKTVFLADKILQAEKPVLSVGGGARKAYEEVRKFAHYTGIPVTFTLRGKGIMDETAVDDFVLLDALGMHGAAYANVAVDNCDLYVNLGGRFDDRVTGNVREFVRNAYSVHIDADPKGIGPQGNGRPNRQPDVTIKADSRKVMKMLNVLIPEKLGISSWHDTIQNLKTEFPFDYDRRANARTAESIDSLIKPQHVIEQIFEITKGEYSVVHDVGQHGMWTMQYFRPKNPFAYDTSGGSGTMGYAIPAAFGLWKISNKKVIAIVGDESFRQTPQALELLFAYDADIKIFVVDNKAPDGTPGGMVRQWYDLIHNGTSFQVKNRPTIVSIAGGYGIPAKEVSDFRYVKESIEKAVQRNGPNLTVFKVDPAENCLPMIPSGGTVKDMKVYQRI